MSGLQASETGLDTPPLAQEGSPVLGELRRTVLSGLQEVARELHAQEGLPLPALEGKLLRPVVAYLGAGHEARTSPSRAFWLGALAIQLVHEASLLHDDVLDGAGERRGIPSLCAREGAGAALLMGDHLLTTAYRAATLTGSFAFLDSFTRAVERTVAGEKAQGMAQGRALSPEEYEEVIGAKSGELFRCALALGALLRDDPRSTEYGALGMRVGRLYQRVDDFLDLCPRAGLGKPPLQDLRQRKWTWPLAEAGFEDFPDASPEQVSEEFFRPGPGRTSVMRRCLMRLEDDVESIDRAFTDLGASSLRLTGVLEGWLLRARDALEREEARLDPAIAPLPSVAPSPISPARTRGTGEAERERVRGEATALGADGEWATYFARHSKSFRFSARLFPAAEGRLVSGVYAYCRFTDDLVDQAPELSWAQRKARLDAWADWSRRAFEGERTDIPLLDEIMGETARRGVPFHYVEELLRGVEMDLVPGRFESLHVLREYSFRVASVVGLWLTELFGTHDPWVLRRAEAMGHAMQLTNILRDVGEDWHRGRLYLPLDRMERFDVTPESIAIAVDSRELPDGWSALVEDLMGEAERDYASAFEAIPALPRFFQRPVAVAGRVYRGIHREIRRNGYDNLRQRAFTSLPQKVLTGGSALWDLRRARRALDPARFEASESQIEHA